MGKAVGYIGQNRRLVAHSRLFLSAFSIVLQDAAIFSRTIY